MLFRVVQECLTNIHRHSGANRAEIHLRVSDGSVGVKVQDNGKGMSAARLSEIQSNASGVGICGMRERVRQLGGQITLESDSSGTTVFFTIPALAAVPEDQRPLAHAAS